MSGNVTVEKIAKLIKGLPKGDYTQMHKVNADNFGNLNFFNFVENDNGFLKNDSVENDFFQGFKLDKSYLAAGDYCCIMIVKTINSKDDQEIIIYIIDENQTNLNDIQKKNIIDFKEAIDNFPVPQLQEIFKNVHNIRPVYEDIDIFYLQFKKDFKHTKLIIASESEGGGKKKVVKYTVKQLQAIASKNNIKITKKVDGKTVRLNKKGLMTKLKRYKLI